jgi:hypothetical protein
MEDRNAKFSGLHPLLTEEFGTEQLRFREHATKSVLNNSFVPIPLSPRKPWRTGKSCSGLPVF